ncbi:MAG: hypothetical protein IPH16_12145 [Haliscomenobacter sp.]|nr:hypothetical protein [Haliscomenobacter sp.]
MRLPDFLPEVSGLAISSPDSLWWHNDSGAGPVLYCTDRAGNLLKEVPIAKVQNEDWEDLARDSQGRIYIGDFGNNRNQRKNLRIYIYDPKTAQVDSILFNYPDQNAFPPPPSACNFDMEGFFYFGDSLHLFSKNRLRVGNYFTKHYVVPSKPGIYTARLRDSLLLPKRVVTGAAISPDGNTVAILSYFYNFSLGLIPKSRTTVFFLSGFPGTDFTKGKIRKKRIAHGFRPSQFEAIDFTPDGNLIIASEKTPVYPNKFKVVRMERMERM